jgi:FG-GAP-like repeat
MRFLTNRALTSCALALALPTLASAQIGWVEYSKDNSKLIGPSNLLLNDTQEKDYAWADLDQDGWTDLVIVRKQPFTTQGRKKNLLLMNEGGVLTDRSTQYASATDVAGDNGFNTPTNDRDVIIADVTGDGWLDVITATTLTPGQPKSLSHPRIYRNLGVDGGGNWLGLLFEEARTPQIKLVSNGQDYFPFFCGVGAGDVTGDGAVDLYFADYDVAGFSDVNDRLFVNDGTGYFADESAARMSVSMLKSPFGTSATIVDINQDGVADVVKNTGLGQTAGNPLVSVSYNNPANVGYFNLLQVPYAGAPYHVNVGDLNKDGKLDLVISDDSSDRYMLNQGNDALGRVKWSTAFAYNTDDGFGSNNIIRDLDGDGWGDVLICDVDVDISGCGRRLHIYHNQGGTVGGNVTIKEESGAGWKGVTGLKTGDMGGTHDVALFDVDNDGDMDMIIGRCNGTSLWLNTLFDGGADIGTNYCDPAVANSTGQPAAIAATGSDVVADNDVTLTTTQMPTNQFGYFITSMSSGFIANPGGSQGNLCLSGTMGRFISQVQNSGALGMISIPVDLNNMPGPVQSQVNPGETWYFTTWYRDNNPGPVSNFANGVSVLFQ